MGSGASAAVAEATPEQLAAAAAALAPDEQQKVRDALDQREGGLRVAAMELLTKAAKDGSLEKTMQEVKGHPPADAAAVQKAPVVVIAGPPAAGKGTQCDLIKQKFGFVHISTGDILRENVKNGTDLGNKAKPFMDAGKLVPSELLVDLVKDRLAQDDVVASGCLLDGFPRAPDQAKAMVDAELKVDKFILIKVPDDVLVERGVGRRLDPETGTIYHMTFKPPPEDIVERLVHRSDDHEEKIRTRLEMFHSQVDGIIPFFEDVKVEIDGTMPPSDVFAAVSAALGSA